MLALTLFLAEHLAVLALIFLAAAGAGTLALGTRNGFAVRCALGLAVWCHVMFFLALIGQLRLVPILVLLIGCAVAQLRGLSPAAQPRDRATAQPIFVLFPILFLVALAPPLAFDETLYHLPFVRELALTGKLHFITDFRFPVFPQFQELLFTPPFLLAGDVTPHLVSLAETAITALLLLEWGRRRGTGPLASAFFLGSPIVLHLATIGYVDAALTMFVVAGFYCLDQEKVLLAGFFFGTACSVKYTGGYFAAAALVIVAVFSSDRVRAALKFAATCAAAALPTTIWLTLMTGDPLFPFVRRSIWSLVDEPVALGTRAVRIASLVWNVTFHRSEVNFQPPVTPLLGFAIVAMLAAALRDARARAIAILCAVFVAIFAFLPQDTRYLVPLLPLIAVVAASAVSARWPKLVSTLAWIAILPGVFYAAYRLTLLGLPPATPAAREAFLRKRIPEWEALMRTGDERVFVCSGEQLKYYARGSLVGDVMGPYSFLKLTDPNAIAPQVQRSGARWYLVSKRHCPAPRPIGMELAYEDEAAQLWRVPR